MASWAEGYVSDIGYTHGYFRELSPSYLRYALLSRRVASRSGRPFRYLELGFGQGLSLNLHAAACAGEFWGTDFLPSQAANARSLAEAAGAGARILDDSFAELAERPDLPEFDMIVMHGIWSWVSAENRKIIVDLVRRKLAIGGTLYVTYNCLPGWAPLLPLRELMALHIARTGAPADPTASRIDAALLLAGRLRAAGAQYFQENPAAADYLEKMAGADRRYLAHEYFNADFQPALHGEIVAMLAEAKVAFVGSANFIDPADHLVLGPEGRALMAGLTDPALRESVRDYLVNRRFRQDIFVKGPQPLPPPEQAEKLSAQGFALIVHPSEIRMTVNLPSRELTMEKVFAPLIGPLAAESCRPKTIAELLRDPLLADRTPAALNEGLSMLTVLGYVHPTQADSVSRERRPFCGALNHMLCDRARSGDEIGFLASPVTGGGIPVSRLHQLFLASLHAGKPKPEDWAAQALEVLEGTSFAGLTARAIEFEAKRLPVLRMLGIA